MNRRTVVGERGGVALRTHPCGVPVFRMTVEEVWSPTLTSRGLLLRKSVIQVHSELPSPRLLSFWGRTVLKAGPKYAISILACCYIRSVPAGITALMWGMMSLSRHLVMMGGSRLGSSLCFSLVVERWWLS